MQGFNMGRYYPPDASNPPSFNTTSHPLGARANKLSQGILTVRFELPFAVWCEHCTPAAIVGQGVRFNAQKKKVGNYYSTPVWSFRMKHTPCGGWWEIRTDPQHSAYVVVEGARKRDYGPEDGGEEADGELRMLTDEQREKRREDAFARLEGREEEKGRERGNKERVGELYEKSEVWRDPYEVNARLRRDFRVKRKMWKREDMQKQGMQEKFSLGMDIVDETEADRVRARLVDFGAAATGEDIDGPAWKPLFVEKHTETVAPVPQTKIKLKADIAAQKSRQKLQQTLVGNTRAAVDPFRAQTSFTPPKMTLARLKRRRDATPDGAATVEPLALGEEAAANSATKLALVGYDSD